MSEPEVLAAVSSTLLEVLRRLDQISQRLAHLETLAGIRDGSETWVRVGLVSAEEAAGDLEDSQSVLTRTWDPVAGRWVYSQQPM
jgi:hypothetical protein